MRTEKESQALQQALQQFQADLKSRSEEEVRAMVQNARDKLRSAFGKTPVSDTPIPKLISELMTMATNLPVARYDQEAIRTRLEEFFCTPTHSE